MLKCRQLGFCFLAMCLLALFFTGCTAVEDIERPLDNDRHASKPIIHQSPLSRPIDEPGNISTGEITLIDDSAVSSPLSDETETTFNVSKFDINASDVLQYLRAMLRINRNNDGPFADIPFSRWAPELLGETTVTYRTIGLTDERQAVFDQIMMELSKTAGMTTVRATDDASARMVFAYVDTISAVLQIPVLAEKLRPQVEDTIAKTIEFPLEPETPSTYVRHGEGANGMSVMIEWLFARPLAPADTGNVLAGLFTKDIYQALSGTQLVGLRGRDHLGTPSDGPVYTWDYPVINLLILNALYKPNVQSGSPRRSVVSNVLINVFNDIRTGRMITTRSSYSAP